MYTIAQKYGMRLANLYRINHLEPTYSIIRSKGKDKDGKETYEMVSFYIVNDAKASKARMRAMENAFKESNMAQQYAKKVSEFVSESFKIESSN